MARTNLTLPSDDFAAQYGIDISDGMHVHKKAVQDKLKELDLPYTLFFCGLFYEYVPMYDSNGFVVEV